MQHAGVKWAFLPCWRTRCSITLGVAVLFPDGLCVTRVSVAAAPHPGSRLEALWTLVKPDGKRRLIIGSVYRPPRRTVADLRADFTDLEE